MVIYFWLQEDKRQGLTNPDKWRDNEGFVLTANFDAPFTAEDLEKAVQSGDYSNIRFPRFPVEGRRQPAPCEEIQQIQQSVVGQDPRFLYRMKEANKSVNRWWQGSGVQVRLMTTPPSRQLDFGDVITVGAIHGQAYMLFSGKLHKL